MSRLFVLAVILAFGSSCAYAAPISLGPGAQPHVVSDGAAGVFVVFGRPGQIVGLFSTDGGATFGAPYVIAQAPHMPLGRRRGPRAAWSKKTMVVTAVAAEKQDGGKTWTKSAKPLNSMTGSASEGLQSLAANRAGRVACVWLDTRNAPADRSGTEVWMSLSDDGGVTWAADRVVYRNAGGTVCECCHPSVAVDDAGNIYVMFRNLNNGNRDMYVTVTHDGGATFDRSRKLGQDTWPLNACPMDGGDLTLAANDGLRATWMSKGQISMASPGGSETRFGPGHQPVVVATAGATWVGWTDDGGLRGAWSDRAPKRMAAAAAYPSAARGKDGRIAVAWQSKETVLFDIFNHGP